MRGEGRAVLLPEDVDTDVIIAGRYLRTKDATVWAEHALEDLDPTLARRLDGAVIVAGKNFGCGSSREQAPIALKGAGVKAVVAPSFARIFFRNAINVGLPVLEGTVGCAEGEVVTFDLDGAWVACGDERVDVRRLSDRMLDIIRAGGLVEYVKERE